MNLEFVCLQPQYNLLCREPEWEIFPAAQVSTKHTIELIKKHTGLGIIPWSPLRGGWLSGKYTRDTKRPESTTEGRQVFIKNILIGSKDSPGQRKLDFQTIRGK